MIPLVVFASFGLLLFIFILAISFRNTPKEANETAAIIAVGEMLSLESLSVRNADQIVDSSDYQVLRSNPALAEVAKRLRRDRRDLALLWFCMLLNDLEKLHRFRGFLLRSGLSTRLYEEIQIAYRLYTSLIFLNFLKVLVRTCGPFALQTLIRRATTPVERMSQASARLLNRLPSSQWHEIANQWLTSAS